MSLLRAGACLYAGLVLSIGYGVLFGPMGLKEYTSLQRRAAHLEANLRSLERTNLRMEEELRSLSTDPETIALLARELGYYRPGDRRVAVPALPSRPEGRTVGQLVSVPQRGPASEGALRVLLLLLPLCISLAARVAARALSHGRSPRRA